MAVVTWDLSKEALRPSDRIAVQDWLARRYLQLRTFGRPERRRAMVARLPPIARVPGAPPSDPSIETASAGAAPSRRW